MIHRSNPKLTEEAGRLAALDRYEILDTDPEREFDDIIGLVKGVFGVPMAAISLIAEDRQWFKAKTGLDAPETPRSVAFCHYTIEGMKPYAVADATRDPVFAANPLVTGVPHIRCYLGVPLTTPEGYNVGSLCILGHEPRAFSDAEGDMLAGFGRLVVSQLELRALARRDALTGALSRHAFEDALRAASAEPVAAPLSLLLFDIDHFKSVNDRFGHPTGDIVLRAVVRAINGELRSTDRLGRLGGEEFGILLTGTGHDAACTLAERVRRRVAGLALSPLQGRAVTLSCGVASWNAGRESIAGWIAAADTALYAAKRAGRDQVVPAA